MTSSSDDQNPLLSTPVATIAVELFKAEMARAPRPSDEILRIANGCTSAAEGIVGVLHERGHLPLKIEAEDEPAADDATLILQGMMLGVVRWQAYDDRDPRGVLRIFGRKPEDEYLHTTKLVGGIPTIDTMAREVLSKRLAPLLRAL